MAMKWDLGACYNTVWELKHKVVQAITAREEPRRYAGFVQIDDTYLGGERNGYKPGRRSENKQPFVAVVATDETLEHPTFAVIEPVRSFVNASLTDLAKRHLVLDAQVFSNGFGCFRGIADLDLAHTVLETASGRAISGCHQAIRQAENERHLTRSSLLFLRLILGVSTQSLRI